MIKAASRVEWDGNGTPVHVGVSGNHSLVSGHQGIATALNAHVLCTWHKAVEFYFLCPQCGATEHLVNIYYVPV